MLDEYFGVELQRNARQGRRFTAHICASGLAGCKVGQEGNEAAKYQVLEGNARPRCNGRDDRYAKDDMFGRLGI